MFWNFTRLASILYVMSVMLLVVDVLAPINLLSVERFIVLFYRLLMKQRGGIEASTIIEISNSITIILPPAPSLEKQNWQEQEVRNP